MDKFMRKIVSRPAYEHVSQVKKTYFWIAGPELLSQSRFTSAYHGAEKYGCRGK